MRIVKSNKNVKASYETGNSNIPTYKLAREIADCQDWEAAGFSCEAEFKARKKEAEEILKKQVNSCGDIKASKNLSPNAQAIKYIKAAIDVLGKSGQKDEITKDSIANLATIMFDIQGDK